MSLVFVAVSGVFAELGGYSFILVTFLILK